MNARLIAITLCALLSGQTIYAQTGSGTDMYYSNGGMGDFTIQSMQLNSMSQTFSPTPPVTLSNGVVVTYDLVATENWVNDPGTLAGYVASSGTGLGVMTTSIASDSGQLNGFDLDNDGTEEVFEGFDLQLIVTSVTGGTLTGANFSDVTYNIASSNFDLDNTLTSATVVMGTVTNDAVLSIDLNDTTEGAAGKVTGFKVNFTAVVPEPNAFMLLGLAGLLLSGRTWYRRRTA